MAIGHEKHRRLPPFHKTKQIICVKEDAVAYGYSGIDFDSDSDFDPEEIKRIEQNWREMKNVQLDAPTRQTLWCPDKKINRRMWI